MKLFKFTETTSTVSIAVFTVFFIYGLFYTPYIQFLVSLAVGGIAYGISESYEIALIAFIAMNYLYTFSRKLQNSDRFQMKETFVNPSEITARIQSMSPTNFAPVITGVGSKMTEGFADAAGKDLTLSESNKETANSSAATATTQPASVNTEEVDMGKMAEMMSGVLKNLQKNGGQVASAQAAPAAPTQAAEAPPAVPKEASEQKAVSGFTDNGSLFRLGKIPEENKGGFHVDAGTTVMNAINALKPDQIKAMTEDTKNLIETQKSLMGMLKTFQPMMNEGKQMMDTFQTMFSPSMGAK
jgi:ribosomal protein L12E/L44/L45/RPP1/RPP2